MVDESYDPHARMHESFPRADSGSQMAQNVVPIRPSIFHCEDARRLEARLRSLTRSVAVLQRPPAVRLDCYQTERILPLTIVELSIEIASDRSLPPIHVGEAHRCTQPQEGD